MKEEGGRVIRVTITAPLSSCYGPLFNLGSSQGMTSRLKFSSAVQDGNTLCFFQKSPNNFSCYPQTSPSAQKATKCASIFVSSCPHFSGSCDKAGRPMHHERQSGTALSVAGEEKARHDCLWFPPAVTSRNMQIWWGGQPKSQNGLSKVARFGLCRIYLELRKFSNSTVFKQCSDEKKTSIKVKRKLVIFLLSF